MEVLLKKLKELAIGCYMKGRFAATLVDVDATAMLEDCPGGLSWRIVIACLTNINISIKNRSTGYIAGSTLGPCYKSGRGRTTKKEKYTLDKNFPSCWIP